MSTDPAPRPEFASLLRTLSEADAYELTERAAIHEHDGHLPRDQAELAAVVEFQAARAPVRDLFG